jgi:nitroreductase
MGAREFYERFPCLIVLLGLMRAFTGEQDRHLVYIDASLAAMAFQFALEVQGISSCCINWPDVPEREEMLAKVLNLELDERPIMLMSAGYADPEGLVPYSQKSSLNDIRSYNKS